MIRRKCLETHIGHVYLSLIHSLAPGLACCFFAVGAHALLLMPFEQELPWLPPLAVAAAVGWFVGGAAWAWYRCPFRDGLKQIAATVSNAMGVQMARKLTLALLAIILLVVLATPLSVAAVVWSSILFIVLFYSRQGVGTFFWLGGLLGGLGLVLAVTLFLFGTAAWLVPVLGVVLVVQSIAIGVGLLRKGWPVCMEAIWVCPVVLPLLIPLIPEYATPAIVAVTGLVVWPMGLLAASILSFRLAQTRARRFLEQNEVKPGLGRDIDDKREAEIQRALRKMNRHTEAGLRESDGYCQLHFLDYRHWKPELSGETGYVSWFRPQVESIMFRSSSLFTNPIACCPDAIGETVSSIARNLIPDLGVGRRLQDLEEAFQRGANIRRLAPQEIPLAKMPWDHPFLLLIPVVWNEPLIIPAGSGIHDYDGFPCSARKLNIEVRIKKEVLDAVDLLSREGGDVNEDSAENAARSDAVERCRKLLWNAWRILPAVFESMLTCLVTQFRGVSVALFMEQDEGLHTDESLEAAQGSREEFLQALNEAVNKQLPAPLGELLTVSVLDIFVDTYLDCDVREEIFRLRIKEANRPLQLQKKVRSQRKALEDMFTKAEDDRREAFGASMMRELLSARQSIVKSAGDARNAILEKVGEMDEGAPRDAFPDIQRNIAKDHDTFVQQTNQRFDEVVAELKRVIKIYGERTW